MSAALVIGGVIALIGVVLLINLLGAGDFMIRVVTSRYLGSLPPGFAASRRGFRVYAALVVAIGAVFAGLGLAESNAAPGAALFVIGALAFVVLSVLVIMGEMETYRALRR